MPDPWSSSPLAPPARDSAMPGSPCRLLSSICAPATSSPLPCFVGGVLGDHTRGGYPYGSVRATLQASSSPSPAASPSPHPSSSEGGAAASGPPSLSRPPPRSPASSGAPASSPEVSTGGGYDTPLLGPQVLSLPQWLTQKAAADPALMMGFVVSCMAGEPGAGRGMARWHAAGLGRGLTHACERAGRRGVGGHCRCPCMCCT